MRFSVSVACYVISYSWIKNQRRFLGFNHHSSYYVQSIHELLHVWSVTEGWNLRSIFTEIDHKSAVFVATFSVRVRYLIPRSLWYEYTQWKHYSDANRCFNLLIAPLLDAENPPYPTWNVNLDLGFRFSRTNPPTVYKQVFPYNSTITKLELRIFFTYFVAKDWVDRKLL